MITYKNYIVYLTLILIGTSCTINSNRMLRTPNNYEFNEIDDQLNSLEYKIDINDELSFQLFTNNGFQLIDMFSQSGNNQQNQRLMMNIGNQGFTYIIRQDSLIELPIIGDVISLPDFTFVEIVEVLDLGET